jgi:glycosyltransferase involved in cell wall biosynthesis
VRVGVNGRRLVGQRLGVARYTEYLLKHWRGMLGDGDQVTVYAPERIGLPFPADNGVRVEPLGPNVRGSVWENVVLPRRARDMDVLFGPGYTLPVRYAGRSVVAIHSVNEVQPGSHGWSHRFTYTPWYKRSSRQADRVIACSTSVKEDLESAYGIPASKISVVLLGVEEHFRPIEDEAVLAETRLKLVGSDRPYILFAGKFSQRRNVPLLMRAFAELKRRDEIPHALLLFGPNVEGLPLRELAEELGVSKDVVQTDGVVDDHRELVAVYSAADLYAFPSAYDGFSLTCLEAMACGVPLVTVNRGALPEISGGAALMIEEPELDALADAMRRVLFDPALRASMREKGLERARRLQWRDTAEATLNVLREVAEG